MGCLAALSRFISRLGERGLPLYRLLRKAERFTWTPEAEEALGNLKALLTNAPILVPPAAGEALLIYIAATTQVVSAAIVVERREEGHALLVQRPVYFISEVLSETKIRYPQIQKLLYAVILTRRKLRHYFESHPVTVVSSFPLGEIIQCREASGRIAKWAVELMGETISFAPRKAIKSQALADFLAEWVDTQLPTAPIQAELWTMYFDGSLMKTCALRVAPPFFGIKQHGRVRGFGQWVAHRRRARGSAPRRSGRLAARHRPSHEEVPRSRSKNGGLLRRSSALRR
jgi:hypothetical protein